MFMCGLLYCYIRHATGKTFVIFNSHDLKKKGRDRRESSIYLLTIAYGYCQLLAVIRTIFSSLYIHPI